MKMVSIMSRGFPVLLICCFFCSVFSGCEDGDEEDCCSHDWAEFQLEGVVQTAEGVPIQGIRVYANNCGPSFPSISDSEGKWQYSYDNCIPEDDDETLVFAVDEDKEENGGYFLELRASVPVKQIEPGDGQWYCGIFAASDVVLEMELGEKASAGTDD